VPTHNETITTSLHDAMAQSMWLDRVHRLFNHPQFLAADPPPRRLLALAQTFSIPGSTAVVDRNVDRPRVAHLPVAIPNPLHHAMDVDSRHRPIHGRPVDLLSIRKALQPRPTGRTTRTRPQSQPTPPGNVRNPQPCPPSCVCGTFLRNAGLEPRYRTGHLLCVKRTRNDHGRNHDPLGRRRTRATIRRRIPSLPTKSPGTAAQDPLRAARQRFSFQSTIVIPSAARNLLFFEPRKCPTPRKYCLQFCRQSNFRFD